MLPLGGGPGQSLCEFGEIRRNGTVVRRLQTFNKLRRHSLIVIIFTHLSCVNLIIFLLIKTSGLRKCQLNEVVEIQNDTQNT